MKKINCNKAIHKFSKKKYFLLIIFSKINHVYSSTLGNVDDQYRRGLSSSGGGISNSLTEGQQLSVTTTPSNGFPLFGIFQKKNSTFFGIISIQN